MIKYDPLLIVQQDSTISGAPYVLTDYQRRWLTEHYHDTPNRDIMLAMGLKHATLHRFVKELHLSKSREGLKKINKATYYEITAPMLRANGWYDTVRPSEACREGARKWREENGHPMQIVQRRDPERYKEICRQRSIQRKEYLQDLRENHPEEFQAKYGHFHCYIKEWKENNPERYKEACEKQSRNTRETIRKERLRHKYGLALKHNLPFKYFVDKFTRSQSRCRTKALKFGYILGDKDPQFGERLTIYYDSETERNEKFEILCQKHGFEIKELDE